MGFSAFFGDDLFGVGNRGRARGGDIAAELEVELVEAAVGIRREVPFEVAVACSTCSGSGARPGTEPVQCASCGGSGRLQQVSRSVFGEFVRTQACSRCGGAGRVIADPCSGCEGSKSTLWPPRPARTASPRSPRRMALPTSVLGRSQSLTWRSAWAGRTWSGVRCGHRVRGAHLRISCPV